MPTITREIDMDMIIEPPAIEHVRLTIPAREALERAGCQIRPVGAIVTAEPPAALRPDLPPSVQDVPVDAPLYDVVLDRVPPGIVLCLIGDGPRQHYGLRLDVEPPYPGEWPPSAIAWHEHGLLTPCPHPRCGRALVWYEAGYVPGYRICLSGHHAMLASDGRSAAEVRR